MVISDWGMVIIRSRRFPNSQSPVAGLQPFIQIGIKQFVNFGFVEILHDKTVQNS
jgi:hypothetical protein